MRLVMKATVEPGFSRPSSASVTRSGPSVLTSNCRRIAS